MEIRNVYYDITNVYDFAECFDISIEIAEAIFEVASTHRPAKIVWADPTPDETKTIVSRAWQLADANELALCWNSKPLWRQDLKHVFACAPNGDDYDVYDVGWASTAEDAARLVMRAKFKVILRMRGMFIEHDADYAPGLIGYTHDGHGAICRVRRRIPAPSSSSPSKQQPDNRQSYSGRRMPARLADD